MKLDIKRDQTYSIYHNHCLGAIRAAFLMHRVQCRMATRGSLKQFLALFNNTMNTFLIASSKAWFRASSESFAAAN